MKQIKFKLPQTIIKCISKYNQNKLLSENEVSFWIVFVDYNILLRWISIISVSFLNDSRLLSTFILHCGIYPFPFHLIIFYHRFHFINFTFSKKKGHWYGQSIRSADDWYGHSKRQLCPLFVLCRAFNRRHTLAYVSYQKNIQCKMILHGMKAASLYNFTSHNS